MKLLLFTMLGQLLQQNIRVNRIFMAGGPCQVLTMALAICRGNVQLFQSHKQWPYSFPNNNLSSGRSVPVWQMLDVTHTHTFNIKVSSPTHQETAHGRIFIRNITWPLSLLTVFKAQTPRWDPPTWGHGQHHGNTETPWGAQPVFFWLTPSQMCC